MDEIKNMFATISANMQAMDNKLSEVMGELRDTKVENEVMRKQIKMQEEKIASLERDIRRKNLVIKGIPDNESEHFEQTTEKVAKICETLGVDFKPENDLDEARRLGRPATDKQRPVLLKLTTMNKKMEILAKTRALKGTNIWIDEDFPKDIQEERKLLIPKLKEARSKGHKAQLKYNKLIINGKIHCVNDIKQSVSAGQSSDVERKRKTDMRSPESVKLEEQLSKITRTSKNVHN